MAAATTQNVTVQLHGVNDAVEITSNNGNPLAVSVAENTTAVTTIVASDVDVGDTFTWSLSGTDAALLRHQQCRRDHVQERAEFRRRRPIPAATTSTT